MRRVTGEPTYVSRADRPTCTSAALADRAAPLATAANIKPQINLNLLFISLPIPVHRHMLIALSRLLAQSAKHLLIANRLQHLLRFLLRHRTVLDHLRFTCGFLRLLIPFAGLLIGGT